MGFFIVVALAAWIAFIGAWLVFSRMFRSADVGRMKSRLSGDAGKKKEKSAAKIDLLQRDVSAGKLAAQAIQKLRLNSRLQTLLEQAGLRWHPTRLVNSCVLLALGGFVACRMMLPIPYLSLQLLMGLAAGTLPILYVVQLRSKRMAQFEEQFPESLEFVARAMRAGHAFAVSLEMLHREFEEPLAGEYRRVFDEHNLGLPLDQALSKLTVRVPLLDVHFFVSAVLLQKRTGGNLAEILDKLAYVIRERFKLRGKIRAISAHGKMTGTALTLIPVGVAVMMFYTNPDYIKFFVEDETGHKLAAAAIGLQIIGYAVIQKIVSIEV